MPAAVYKEKLAVVEALQYDGTNGAEIDAWLPVPPDYHVHVIQAGPNQKVNLRTDPDRGNTMCWLEAGYWVTKNPDTPILEVMYPEQFAAKYGQVI